MIFSKSDNGDCLYGILSRRVRIYSNSAEGAEIMFNVLEQGDLFGEVALLDGSTRTASAATMEQILAMLTLLCQRLRWTSSVIEDAVFLAFPARLAKRLLVLAEHYRKPHEHEVTVPLSQHELGSMVSTGRETINKQLALWRSAGIVDTTRGAIVIRDCEALRALVGCV